VVEGDCEGPTQRGLRNVSGKGEGWGVFERERVMWMC